jgi:antitoxin (DNA-binding transcriptional repressor) of toxin-antitoxin stability system
MDSMTASSLARNTTAVLDRVARERQPILITRGGRVVARLSPEVGTMTAAQAFANFNVPPCASIQASPFKR